MSFNIVDLVNGQISDSLLGEMGKVLGTEGSRISTAVGAAVPGLLSGLGGVVTRPGGAEALARTAHAQDEGLLDRMGALLGGGDDTSRVIEQGTGTLESLLGHDAHGKLRDALADFSGLGRSDSGSLLGMLAPIVVGTLRRRSNECDLDANALAALLGEQRANIDAAMPSGFAERLQGTGFADAIAPGTEPVPADRPAARPSADTPSSADVPPASDASLSRGPSTVASDPATTPVAGTTPTAAPPQSPPPATASASGHHRSPNAQDTPAGGGIVRWLLPLAAVVVLGLIAWSFLGGDEPDAASGQRAAGGTAQDAAEEEELPEGLGVDDFTAAIDEVTGAVAATLEGVTDEPSARAALPDLKDANTKVNALSENVARLPAAAASEVSASVGEAMSDLRPVADKVLGMPSVGPIVEPVVRPMLETLEKMTN